MYILVDKNTYCYISKKIHIVISKKNTYYLRKIRLNREKCTRVEKNACYFRKTLLTREKYLLVVETL